MQGAAPGVVDDWRARQAEWKLQYDQWKRQQADLSRDLREQRTAESARLQAEALERARLDRLANPRTSGPFVAMSLGVAVIVGALASSIAWSALGIRDFQTAFGFAAATGVVGLSMVVAGLLRRRSGFLAFVAIALTLVTVLLLTGRAFDTSLFDGLPSFTFSF
ncbi:hypothetical protein GCM10025867_37820 [Frondihabitans sucicola]|uniref:Uncharacterized protein n=2 Tax=Frondihabitans sucicola TaxID=1268041 RepID=A0ABN6Y6C0_9MICO|nr:hypothetical protein GCM10025867_37820 [Frondihabitans sucicola]